MIVIRTYLFKRRTSKDKYSWRVRWKDPGTGRWKAVAGGRSESEAKIIEAQIRQDLLRGTDPIAATKEETDKWTVSQVVKEFYEHSRFLSGNDIWRKEVKQKIDNDIIPQLGAVPFRELNPDRVFKFYLTLKARGLVHATIDKYHNLLRIIGDIYAEQSQDLINPVRRIRDFSKRFPKQAPSRDINFLTHEELEKLFLETEHSRGPLLSQFARFLANTGLRRSEAQRLKWTDIDEQSKFLHVRMSKPGKSRTVPLDPEALAAVISLKGNGPMVFTKADGTLYYPDSFLRPLQRAARRAGITKRIDIHTLRHSYGSNKIRMGWGIKKVSVLLGHADISTTSKIYTHLLDGDLRIRDDARLDVEKTDGSNNIERPEIENQKVAQLIAEAVTGNLTKSAEGRRVLSEFVQSLSAVSSLVQQADPATSVEDQRDFLNPSEKGPCAPLMLHSLGEAVQQPASTPREGNELSSLFQGVEASIVGGMQTEINDEADVLRKRCSTTELHRRQDLQLP